MCSSITMALITARGMTTPPQDDRNIVNRWSALAAEHDLDLVLCVAAAQRRGILDADEAKRNGKDARQHCTGFPNFWTGSTD